MLQCVAVFCSELQCVTVTSAMRLSARSSLAHVECVWVCVHVCVRACVRALQRTAAHCNTLHLTATHCNSLQQYTGVATALSSVSH